MVNNLARVHIFKLFLITALRLGIPPSDCVVVEDAEAGVEAAIEAGMKCIGIGSPLMLKRANIVFSKTSDIRPSTVRALDNGGRIAENPSEAN